MHCEVKHISKSKVTIEGAGVHLRRAFGYFEIPQFDPFLLLDDFRADMPELFIKGFPWHPHRGIETVTYVLAGKVEHEDSLGNVGIIEAGDMQWMTAGSGILHQEMPQGNKQGRIEGFQLWVNLSAANKMTMPFYREVKKAEIPELNLNNGVKIKILCGGINGLEGSVRGIDVKPEFFDITIPENTEYIHSTSPERTVFAYVINGNGKVGFQKEILVDNHDIVLFEKGEKIKFMADRSSMRFLLISGMPLNEPIAWRGPIVMNTKDELNKAFDEYRSGRFIKDS